MAPKRKVNRDDIIAAARALLEEGGPALVTARAVADRLQVSTRPIYSLFASMDEVLEAIVPELEAELNAHMTRQWTGRELADMGVGILVYGRDHPEALDFLLATRPGKGQLTRGSRMHGEFVAALKETAAGQEILSAEVIEEILFKLEIFTQGLLEYMRHGGTKLADAELVRITDETGEALILYALGKNE